ncbi:methyl-accepting chemotaxis protein, partial [Dickeya dianthicola]|nr:methyl-accepting chemotaxis protein [Dickeya dianthicola]
QQNAALVEQASAAAASLEDQAQNLAAAVAAFELGDTPTALHSPRVHAPALKRPALKQQALKRPALKSSSGSSSHGDWETF